MLLLHGSFDMEKYLELHLAAVFHVSQASVTAFSHLHHLHHAHETSDRVSFR